MCSGVSDLLCPMSWCPPGSSVHGVSQARTLAGAVISSSRGSSRPGIEPASLSSPVLAGRFFTTVLPEKHNTKKCIVHFHSCILLATFLPLQILLKREKSASEAFPGLGSASPRKHLQETQNQWDFYSVDNTSQFWVWFKTHYIIPPGLLQLWVSSIFYCQLFP